jgi:phenylpropionate dioxygenase-like ring-hydroxylating dioxygenase large terminal subunit
MELQNKAHHGRPKHAPSEEAIEAYYEGMRSFWYPVLPSEDLTDKPVGVELLGEWLAVARLEGEPVAFSNLCRHLGAALALGDVVGDGCYLRCAYHGWTYDKTGQCVDIPARRGVSIPRGARVRTYPIREAYGLVWVCLDSESQYDIPEYPEFDDPGFYREKPLIKEGPWRASAVRVVLATLDDSHFPWVHPGILGDEDHPEPPEHHVWREGNYLHSQYETLQPAAEAFATKGSSDGLRRVKYTYYATPNSVRMLKEGDNETYSLLLITCPHTHDQTTIYLHRVRNFDKSPERDPEYTELQKTIVDQDRPIVESQRPWLLPPLSSRLMLYTRPADQPLIEFQKWLEELGIPQV